MIDAQLLTELRHIVGDEYVSVSRAEVEVYSYDASHSVELRCTSTPGAVILPADTSQIAEVVQAATRARVPYLPRGFGTNLSGGTIIADGGLVIGLSRMNRIVDIRPEARYAVVEPGVTNLELQEALAPLGFTYAPDPASQKVATLGGNLGENSGGPHCLKYGVTSNHVLGMTAVLPDGQVIDTGGPALDPPGYDLRGVLIGSEGTLAIVTQIVVRILPLPESVVTMLVVYDDITQAAQSVSDVIAAGIVPATLEMVDATVIGAIEDSKPSGYPRDAAAVLIVEVDGPAAGLEAQAERIGQICTDNGCREVRRAKDDAERDQLWSGRRGAFGAIARLAPNFLVNDCTVPRDRIPEALKRVAAIADAHRIGHGNVFHAGDGNLHPLLLYDARDADQTRRVHEAAVQVVQACVALGGTITGEHGVGLEKISAMRMIFSEDDLNFQRSLRGAFDADDLLNPGKILPPPVDADEPAEETPPPGETIAGRRELVPVDVDQACEWVRRAVIEDVALLPTGNGTQSGFDHSCPRKSLQIHSTNFSSVVDYDPANQVVVAGSGMTLRALQELLAERGQWLPLRPPQGGRCTLGGLAALGTCGPERMRYGAPRDLALGLRFISAEGRLIAAGGRVVKNVAGYDLTRLLIGSMGTLGLITELTFQVASLPECCVAQVAKGPLQQCAEAATALLCSHLDPAFVIGLPTPRRQDEPALRIGGQATGNGDPWQLIAGFEGFEAAVTFQTECCRTMFDGAGLNAGESRRYAAREGLCGESFDLLGRGAVRMRADLPLDRVVSLIDGAFLSATAETLGSASVLVDFGCGRVTVSDESLTSATWKHFCETARSAAGHAVLEKAPRGFVGDPGVFGPARADWPMMQRIKAALDPVDVFAPGRLPGGE